MNIYLEKIKKFVIKYINFKNILLIFSIVSLNFISYIISFNIDIIQVIDLTTINKHVLEIILIYALSMGFYILVITFILEYFVYLLVLLISFIYPFRTIIPYIYKIKEFIKNYNLIKYTIVFIISSVIYVGEKNTYILFIIVIIYSIILVLVEYVEQISKKQLKIDNARDYYREFIKIRIDKDVKNNLKLSFIKNIPIILLLISMSSGYLKANYVKNNLYFTIPLDNKVKNIIPILSTSKGLLIYINDSQSVELLTWNSLKKITMKDKKYKNLFESLDTFINISK